MDSNETQNREPLKQAMFAINLDGAIVSAMEVVKDDAAQFQSARDLEKLAEGWPASTLFNVFTRSRTTGFALFWCRVIVNLDRLHHRRLHNRA
jgi:hypothetical protein